jgi:excisionase family DNA binding protein
MIKTEKQKAKDQAFINNFIRVSEAAEILGKTSGTVYNWMNSGKLDTVTLCKGRSHYEILFYRDQVEALKK